MKSKKKMPPHMMGGKAEMAGGRMMPKDEHPMHKGKPKGKGKKK